MTFFRHIVVSLSAFATVACAFAEQLALTPFRASGIYELGERAGWTVSLPPSSASNDVSYSYTLKKNNSTLIASGPLDLHSHKATIETTLDEPAMLYLELSASSAATNRQTAGAAIAPTKLKPTAPRPPDFDAFWESKIKLLHAIDPEPVLTPEESGQSGVDYWTIKMKNIEGAHVYGQLARPIREGKFPAMLILQ